MPLKHIGPALSRVQKGLLKKPIRKAKEGPLAWYKRLKRWMDATEGHRKWKERQRSKPKKPKKVKKAKPKTIREKIIEERKKTEKQFGIRRGIGKKPKTKPKKKKKK